MNQNSSPRRRSAPMTVAVFAITLGMATVGSAAPIRHGTNADAKCEVVSVGQWYCTIDGKGYYCDTKTNPDPNKNCRPARIAPTGPKSAFNQGLRNNAPIMRRGIEGESPTVAEEQAKDKAGEVTERAVNRPKPRPRPNPVPPKGPTDPQPPPIGPGGTGPTIPK